MERKSKPDHGIWAMLAFAGVGFYAGFLSRSAPLRYGLLSIAVAGLISLGGCTPIVVSHIIAKAESPEGISVKTPEELDAASKVRFKTDNPEVLRRLFYLAGSIMAEPRQMPLVALQETENHCLNVWPKLVGQQVGSPFGAVYAGGGRWIGLCYTKEPLTRENAKVLCEVLGRPLLENIPEQRRVVCGAKGGTGV